MRLYDDDFIGCGTEEIMATLNDLGKEYACHLDYIGDGVIIVEEMEGRYLISIRNWECVASLYED